MPCPRCAGMRVTEMITEGGMRSAALRCLHCGDITDHVIAKNRRQPPRYVHPSRARTPVHSRHPYKRDGLSFG